MGFKKVSIIASFSVFALYAILIGSLFVFVDTSDFISSATSPRVLYALRLSISAAVVATILAILLALPAAYALSRHEFRGKALVDGILELPLIISPAALGAIVLIFFSTSAAEPLRDFFVFEIPGVVLAQFITIIGIATRLIKAVLDEISPRYELVARTLGASQFKAFMLVTFPMSYKGILAAAVLCWAKAIGEFGATIMIAGSMAMKTETLPIAIFSKISTADIEGTAMLILILLSIGFVSLYAIRFLGGRATKL